MFGWWKRRSSDLEEARRLVADARALVAQTERLLVRVQSEHAALNRARTAEAMDWGELNGCRRIVG